MKKNSILGICVLFLFCQFAIAQKTAVVSADKFNILYQGIENPVSIAVPGIASDKIQVSVINGSIKKIDDTHYLVNPIERYYLTLNVFSVNKTDTIYYGTFPFKIKQIPEPDLYVANTNMTTENKINKNNLLIQPVLFYKMADGFEFEIKTPALLSFKLTYMDKGSVIDKSINGNTIPKEIINNIMQLEPETKIILSDIKISVNGNVRASAGCSFTIY